VDVNQDYDGESSNTSMRVAAFREHVKEVPSVYGLGAGGS
jgi:hypothetical protein